MKALLVDDSNAMRRIQKNVLEKAGATEVVEAEDGKIALGLLEVKEVDVILLDWNMPNMDGLTFLKNMRTVERYKDIKVIMCTSESEKSKIMEALKAGANSYIVKPFTADVLKAKLKDLKIL